MANPAKVRPVPIGTVADAADIRFRATVTSPPGSVPITEFEVELGPFDTEPRGWGPAIFQAEGFVEFDDDEADDDDDEPDDGPIRKPRFETIDGCEAERGMTVGRIRPRIRLSAVPDARQFLWVLNQDGVVRDRGRGRIAHSHDGRACVVIVPQHKLRRSGQDWEDRIHLRPGQFMPPFSRFAEDVRVRRYTAGTRPGHSEFAVDFNRGSGGFDEGDIILAPAAGKVIRADLRPDAAGGNGEVEIDHGRGWHTVYAHMRDIKVDTGLHNRVELFDRIGTLSDVGKSSGHADSPHLHHQHLRHGVPRKMRFLGVGNIGRTKDQLTTPFATKQRRVEGAIRPRGAALATMRVAVRTGPEAPWSKAARVRFKVASREAEIEPCEDIDCDITGADPAIVEIDAEYDGEDLEPGPYSVRYRGVDADGVPTRWAFDHSVVVA